MKVLTAKGDGDSTGSYQLSLSKEQLEQFIKMITPTQLSQPFNTSLWAQKVIFSTTLNS